MNGLEGVRRLLAAAGLWTISGMMVSLYIVSPDWKRGMGTLGIFIGLVALAMTFSVVVEAKLNKHRLRVQELMTLIEAERAKQGMSRIH